MNRDKLNIICLVTTPPPPQLNSKFGCNTKMTLVHPPPPPPPTQTQYHQYLSCSCPDFKGRFA